MADEADPEVTIVDRPRPPGYTAPPRRCRRSPRHTPPPSGYLLAFGLRPLPTAGGGECLFNAVNGSADMNLNPATIRSRLYNELSLNDAATRYDAYGGRGVEYAGEARYIRKKGNWPKSIHIAATAVLLDRSIAVISANGSDTSIYGTDATWRTVDAQQLRAIMYSAEDPLIIIGLQGRVGHEHFVATAPVL